MSKVRKFIFTSAHTSRQLLLTAKWQICWPNNKPAQLQSHPHSFTLFAAASWQKVAVYRISSYSGKGSLSGGKNNRRTQRGETCMFRCTCVSMQIHLSQWKDTIQLQQQTRHWKRNRSNNTLPLCCIWLVGFVPHPAMQTHFMRSLKWEWQVCVCLCFSAVSFMAVCILFLSWRIKCLILCMDRRAAIE